MLFFCLSLALLVIAIVVFARAWLTLRDADTRAATQAHTRSSLTHTWTTDGDDIKAYVIADPDTQVQYVVTDHGGVTPRLDRDGQPMGVADEQ